jgi:hypothetical protein
MAKVESSDAFCIMPLRYNAGFVSFANGVNCRFLQLLGGGWFPYESIYTYQTFLASKYNIAFGIVAVIFFILLQYWKLHVVN